MQERVPVMCGLRCLERADEARVKRLRLAPNAELVRRHRDGVVVEIQMHEAGDDSERKFRRGNPLRYSHDLETGDNPARVWMLKHVPNGARGIFREVLTSCQRAA